MITGDGFRLTRWNHNGEGQMFDLKNDPSETRNLFRSPAYRDKRMELYEKMLKILSRPYALPQYKNMPDFRGKKARLGGEGNSQFVPACPIYGKKRARIKKKEKE